MLDLLKQFLYFNPQQRLKASDALQHPFFLEIDQDDNSVLATDSHHDMEITSTTTTTPPVNIPPPLPTLQTCASTSSHSQISPSYSSIETMCTIVEDHNEPSITHTNATTNTTSTISHVTITQINNNEHLLDENVIMNEIHYPSKENSLSYHHSHHPSTTTPCTGKRRQISVDLTDEFKLRKRDIDVQQQHSYEINTQMDLDEHIHTHRQLSYHPFDNNDNNNDNDNETTNDSVEAIESQHQDDNNSTSSKSGNISGER